MDQHSLTDLRVMMEMDSPRLLWVRQLSVCLILLGLGLFVAAVL